MAVKVRTCPRRSWELGIFCPSALSLGEAHFKAAFLFMVVHRDSWMMSPTGSQSRPSGVSLRSLGDKLGEVPASVSVGSEIQAN